MKRIELFACATVFAAFAGAAQADDGLYYGFGLGLSSVTSDPTSFSGIGRGSAVDLGFSVGYRKDFAKAFVGGELDGEMSLGADLTNAGVPCSTVASGPYFCTHDATLRARVIVGTPVGDGVEAFGSLGMVAVKGDSATNSFTQGETINTGFTIGAGVQTDYRNGKLRAEIIYDRANNVAKNPAIYEPHYEAMSLKVSFLF